MPKGVHHQSDRPQTQKKLELLAQAFDVWLAIWLGQKGGKGRPLVVLDLFAGTGKSYGADGNIIDGSTLVLMNLISDHAAQLKSQGRSVIIRSIEAKASKCEELVANTSEMLRSMPALADVVDFQPVCTSANKWIAGSIEELRAIGAAPAFVFVDPDGLQVDKVSIDAIMALPWRTDFFYNYMAEGVARVAGAAASDCATSQGNRVKLVKYLGEPTSGTGYFDASAYADKVFTPAGFFSVPFPMPNPSKDQTQYILIYASKNETVVDKVIRDVFARSAKVMYRGQGSLFDLDTLKTFVPSMGPRRKTHE